MNRIFEKVYTLRAGDFDKYDRLHPAAVLDLFQDVAGQHAETLGVGFEAMLQRSYLWVLVRVKYHILAPVHRYQSVRVKTWPLEPRRLSYRREYCIEDENGKRLVAGSSEWVVIDSVERRLCWVPSLYPANLEFCTEVMCEDKLRRVPEVQTDGNVHTVLAGFSDLDVNDHVNNVKYANYVMDAINPTWEEEIESFQIDYRKEVVQGTELLVSCGRKADGIYACGEDGDHTQMFTCKLTLKQ